jgi:PKD repeat protein
MLGVTNDANGAGVWQKTVTADFSAAPLTGRPPLAVSFSNASTGDVTSTQWDFGDGQTSTAANPTHTYTQAGAYTVRLTVSDGVDSHTLTRPGYVDAWYRTFLPLSFRGYDPTLYDGFDNEDYDGGYNPLLWSFEGDTTVQFRQQSGTLVVTNLPSSDPSGTSLRMRHPWLLRWQQVQQIQARLKISSDRSGGWSPIGVAVTADEVNGHTWYAECGLAGATHLSQASFGCYIFIRQGNSYPNEYETPGIAVNYDTWHTIRIELDPNTANVRFYLDNALIGSHTPSDAASLLTSEQVQIRIVVWGAAADSTATRYVDDVRITPAQ